MRSLLMRLRDSVAFYPVTAVYVAGVVVALALTVSWINLTGGLVALTAIAVTVVLISIRREVKVLQVQLSVQADELQHISTLVEKPTRPPWARTRREDRAGGSS